MFKKQLDCTIEVYIDNMVVKSMEKRTHLADLVETFGILPKYKIKLNASKCAFGIGSGKFLGYIINHRGIEANPRQITAILKLGSSRSVKEVQKLMGMAAALNRFISRSTDCCRQFFYTLRQGRAFEWTLGCQAALDGLKTYLQSVPLLATPLAGDPHILYLAVSDRAVSAVLLKEELGERRPVYYVSKAMADAETHYLSLEKLILTLVMATRKLMHSFQGHTIGVRIDYPFRSTLYSHEASGRISKWALELGKYDIQFLPRISIKGQVLADFVAEFTGSLADFKSDQVQPKPNWRVYVGDIWQMYCDGTSNQRDSGVGIVIMTPEEGIIEQAVKLGIDASNNEAEYEVLLTGLRNALHLGARRLLVFCDSKLVINQLKVTACQPT